MSTIFSLFLFLSLDVTLGLRRWHCSASYFAFSCFLLLRFAFLFSDVSSQTMQTTRVHAIILFVIFVLNKTNIEVFSSKTNLALILLVYYVQQISLTQNNVGKTDKQTDRQTKWLSVCPPARLNPNWRHN